MIPCVATAGNSLRAALDFFVRICCWLRNNQPRKLQHFRDLRKIYLMIRIPSLAPFSSRTAFPNCRLKTCSTDPSNSNSGQQMEGADEINEQPKRGHQRGVVQPMRQMPDAPPPR